MIVQIRLTKHKFFMRKGADLIMEKEITLLDALTGVDFVITHLDGKKIRIKNNPGEVLKHDEVKVVENMGMPFHKKVYAFGNLFIHFKVKFPDTLDPKSMTLIQNALGAGGKKKGSAEKHGGKNEEHKDQHADEVVEMKKFEEFHKNTHHGGGERGNDSEDEDDEGHHGGHHGQRM